MPPAQGMGADAEAAVVIAPALFPVLIAALLGLIASVGIERFLHPRPCLRRPLAVWEAYAGLWCAGYGSIVLLIGRPWCALAAVLAVLITLVLVNNAKMRSLREPFVFQDYDFFFDAVMYPRLFLPLFGLKKFLQAAAFFFLAIVALYWESPPIHRFSWSGQLGGVLIVLGAAAFFLWRASRHDLPISGKSAHDMRNLGLLAYLWAYYRAEHTPPDMRSPFDAADTWERKPNPLPHLVSVQFESFFDARTLYSGIRPGILAAFDAIRAESTGHGALGVSAWGGNTVRTEFAFLTGVEEDGLGVHRFHPYRTTARGRYAVSSLPMFLKSLGYRTICIHPYWARFYSRDRVFRQFGFDEFLDIRSFAGAQRYGPYVADAEVGKKIIHVLREAACPTFVFAITMESHGPLHLERVRPSDLEELYRTPPPPGCDDLTIYLRHLRNTDGTLLSLHSAFVTLNAPIEFCCFGDHVPIMPEAYTILGSPEGTVPYLLWSSQQRHGGSQPAFPLPAHALAPAWLQAIRA